MKLRAALLVGSFALNALFAAALLWQPDATRAFLRDAFARSAPTTPALRVTTPSPATGMVERGTPAEPGPALHGINWDHLQSTDFATVMAQLTQLGVPPTTARTMTAFLVHRHFEARRRALRAQPDPMEYWRNPHGRPEQQEIAAHRELDREAKRVLREVIGPDLSFDDDPTAQRRQFGALAEEKVAKLKKIFADYSDLEEQLFADGGDRNSPAMRARSALLAKEKRADIERLLTPDELLDYDLRNSQGAHRLRGKIGGFQATEAEFRALYPAFQAAAEAEAAFHRGERVNITELRRTREATEQQLEAEMRRVLGDARYGELQDMNDPGLRETRALVASLNLPPATASQLIAIQKEIHPQLTAVERNRDLTPNQRDAQLAALGAEARARLTRVIGPEGFEAYKRRGGGWLGQALNPRP